MNRDPSRPDPDDLVASLRRAESRAGRGNLKVFFGMCPGVGKTYAMLRAARRARAEGVDVVIGIVETHGRAETEAMAEGLERVPLREIAHRGARLAEMDADDILNRKPRLVVVDELAHSNAPGSRHAKRWQDVVELLEAGLDVLTTLNVQHLESRADAVRQITGIPVRETVPDSVLDLADEIELLDLTTQALRERLRDGKVYLGDTAATAAEHFFQESNLNALRELALRFTAERVDRQLRELRSSSARKTVWRSGERLLVAVGPSPFSTQLVRWTRRLAAAQGAPWIAAHVERSTPLPPESQRLLDRNLSLARELGADVVVTRDEDIASALVRTALRHNATQIVVGKPRSLPFVDWLRGGSLVDRLLRHGGNIDIYLVPAESGKRGERDGRTLVLSDGLLGDPREYAWAAGVVATITVLGLFLPSDTYLAVGLVYLLAIVALGLRLGRWPVLLAGVASALTWNFLFIPPRFTFQINKVEDATLFATYFLVAVIVSQLTARIRAQALNERSREQRATALLELTKTLTEARTLDEAVFAALRQIDGLFGMQSALLLADETHAPLTPHFAGSFAVDEKERSVAAWAFSNKRPAGRETDTLPASAGYYLPLVCEDRAFGVLGIFPGGKPLPLSQRDLLSAFAAQLALVVERDHLQAASEREKFLAEAAKLHRALFDSVSHELRTPLAVITGALDGMPGADEKTRACLIEESRSAARRLNRLVGNLLDQTRLDSGAIRPKPDWCDARDIVNAVLESLNESIGAHPLAIEIPPELPSFFLDFALTERALANLLLNAATHTPCETPIVVRAGVEGRRCFFSVSDRGAGIPLELRSRLFLKFARGDSSRSGGIGLGLSIVRGFVTAQEGEVIYADNPSGGSLFTIYLPHRMPQAEEPEA